VHLEQLDRVLVLAAELLVALEPPRQERVLGCDRRRMLLVVPEPRRRELALELPDAAREHIGVKGNHEPSRAGLRSPRAAAGAGRAVRSSARWYRARGRVRRA